MLVIAAQQIPDNILALLEAFKNVPTFVCSRMQQNEVAKMKAESEKKRRSVFAGGDDVGGFGNGEAVALGVRTDCLFDS